MSEVERLLAQVEGQVKRLREALDDEHEGDARKAALLLSSDADKLAMAVLSW